MQLIIFAICCLLAIALIVFIYRICHQEQHTYARSLKKVKFKTPQRNFVAQKLSYASNLDDPLGRGCLMTDDMAPTHGRRRAPGLDFVAIDFETANDMSVSACAIGIALYEKGVLKQKLYGLIRPVGNYLQENITIHGITPEMTAKEGDFSEIWPQIEPLFMHYPVLSYSKFDRNVFNSLISYYRISLKSDIAYFDVYRYARRAIPDHLENYKLPTVAKYFGIKEFKHHNALDDAIACADIYLSTYKLMNGWDVDELSATQKQLNYISFLGGTPSPEMSKAEASSVIDSLLVAAEARAIHDEEMWEKCRPKREAWTKLNKKLARENKRKASAMQKARSSEELELQALSQSIEDDTILSKPSKSERLRNLRSFQSLVNDMLADNIIEPDEVRELKEWLIAHRRNLHEFAVMIRLCDEVLVDGVVDEKESSQIYDGVLDCLVALRKKPVDEQVGESGEIPKKFKERWDFVRCHPFRDLRYANVVITGSSFTFAREDAEGIVEGLGAKLKSSCTRDADFCLILGEPIDKCFTTKANKARELQTKGSPIRIIDENEFIELVNASMGKREMCARSEKKHGSRKN